MHYHRNHPNHQTHQDREPIDDRSFRSRVADLSLVVPFIPVFVVLYGSLLAEYVIWHMTERSESNNK
jgi:hypothetical protein